MQEWWEETGYSSHLKPFPKWKSSWRKGDKCWGPFSWSALSGASEVTFQFIPHQNLRQTSSYFLKFVFIFPRGISKWRNVGNKWSWCENERICSVEKVGIFTGNLAPRIGLIVRNEFILTVGFRVQAETSHFCEEMQHISPLLLETMEHKLVFMLQGSLG